MSRAMTLARAVLLVGLAACTSPLGAMSRLGPETTHGAGPWVPGGPPTRPIGQGPGPRYWGTVRDEVKYACYPVVAYPDRY